MKRVSVVIPCYNTEHFLRDAIESALGQTYSNVEVVVVDDGSTDDSPAIMAAYGDRIKVIRQANLGLAAARNTGIRESQGHFLGFLDADDWWRADFVEKMVSALETSDAGIAYCGWQNVGLPGGRGKPFVPPDYENHPDKLKILIHNTCWPVHAALVRRQLVELLGPFNPKWTSCEDFAFWICAATSQRLVLVPEVMAYYRHHTMGQMTKQRDVIARNHWLVQKEFLAHHPETVRRIGRSCIREITDGELLRRGYVCYWERDLESARAIFRMVMKTGYGTVRDWIYMLPALLPFSIHNMIIKTFGRSSHDGR